MPKLEKPLNLNQPANIFSDQIWESLEIWTIGGPFRIFIFSDLKGSLSGTEDNFNKKLKFVQFCQIQISRPNLPNLKFICRKKYIIGLFPIWESFANK